MHGFRYFETNCLRDGSVSMRTVRTIVFTSLNTILEIRHIIEFYNKTLQVSDKIGQLEKFHKLNKWVGPTAINKDLSKGSSHDILLSDIKQKYWFFFGFLWQPQTLVWQSRTDWWKNIRNKTNWRRSRNQLQQGQECAGTGMNTVTIIRKLQRYYRLLLLTIWMV